MARSGTIVWAMLGAALALGACGRASVFQPRRPEVGDAAVARVAGDTIWTSDVKREAAAQGLIGEGEPLDAASEEFRHVLDQVIDQRLLAAEATREGLDKDPVVRRRLKAAHDKLLGDVLVESVVDKAVNDNAIRALYQEQQRLAHAADEIRARQILAPTQTDAVAVLKLLAAGASFDALAMQRSTDAATRFAGGDLGYFTLDAMPEAYGAALKSARIGETVGPIKTDGGYAVIRVEDRRPEKPLSLEAARPQIVRFLTYDEIRTLLNRLRSGAHVTLMIPAKGAGDHPPTPRQGPPSGAAPSAQSQ